MQTRLFGRTGHHSTVAIFGGFALSQATPAQTDRIMEKVLAAGINHIDIAPSYGIAEERLGPWLPQIRDRVFLGCKTTRRSKDGAAAELRRSLERLQTDHFDLYQIHAVETMADLDAATGPGSALDAIIEAREEGLTRFIGITGHGVEAPSVFLEALRRFDFDSVLFPINFIQYGNPKYRRNAEELLRQCRERKVGTMIIKAISQGPWGDHPKTHITWYRPFTDPVQVQQAVDFALSQDVTGLCTAGDPQILPQMLHACENFRPMPQSEQDALIATASQYEPLFA